MCMLLLCQPDHSRSSLRVERPVAVTSSCTEGRLRLDRRGLEPGACDWPGAWSLDLCGMEAVTGKWVHGPSAWALELSVPVYERWALGAIGSRIRHMCDVNGTPEAQGGLGDRCAA